ncbi:hypothetical protein SAMN05192558_104305 [Actinokineospora alba]|uniref:Signal peptidase I n=1 Tax=Actinokineospora alba TaxID=504798 RepID=A0A1H0LVX8_9PSEU|nr:DUF5684 domain-containing protein [Actinokineospora alba]TDP67477.1 hypothetical protein C8E96_3022 [Actinokineospora alba]SDI47320.1 hypothetical protein SAMN05421871_105155 [Actinokineospora alba]SDO72253.1 hypothetical protein SAMN05192558_104305 [Actinokineospora alba]
MESESTAYTVVSLVLAIIAIAGLWMVFKKAGRPGWWAIIPIVNVFVTIKIAGRAGWWILLFLIPIVNVVIAIIVSIDLAKKFGKSAMFGVFGLFLFPFIGTPMIGFGDAQYQDELVAA